MTFVPFVYNLSVYLPVKYVLGNFDSAAYRSQIVMFKEFFSNTARILYCPPCIFSCVLLIFL